ncbi:hypothetical protein BDV93DRAFT_528678 [Ceratobasidium sp. AG-I]|nr:hypothetical protein BDV93DRAFT_528678 [Ceratobasidium sp. AG-I]
MGHLPILSKIHVSPKSTPETPEQRLCSGSHTNVTSAQERVLQNLGLLWSTLKHSQAIGAVGDTHHYPERSLNQGRFR